ncbi:MULTISPECIES: hypothetical protein [unclassified Geodermatophilus]
MTGQPYEQEWDAVPPGSAAPPYAAPPPPAYGPPAPYGPPPGYAPAHGQGPGYAPYPGYGPPPGYGWGVPPAWPAGPGRPGVATAAGVLGIVAGSLSGLVALVLTAAVLSGDDDAVSIVLVLGLPCGAALVTGGIRLLTRHSPAPLFVSALAAVAVLFLALAVGAGTLGADGLVGFTAFLVFALPLPVLTAVFARLPATVGWAAGR